MLSRDLVFYSDKTVLERMASALRVQEYVIARHFSSEKELEQYRSQFESDVVQFKFCHVLERENAQELKRFRKKADFVGVMGKDVGRNKFAVQQKAGFLLMPCSFEKPEMDAGIARIAAESDVTIAVLLSDFLKASALQRSMGLKNYQLVNLLCRKFDTKLEVFSGARKESELRAPRDLDCFKELLK